jgi:fatty acid desaturase
MCRLDKKQLAEAHRPRWAGIRTWLILMGVFVAAEGVVLAAVLGKAVWLTGVAVLAVAHLMHGHLIAFHEAAHGMLCPSRACNDGVGFFVGVLSFTSLSLYRAAHHLHHAHLGTERDEELWPFVRPSAPRWLRRTAAFLELTAGLVWTPLLLLRCFVRPGSPIQGPVRRRIWAELALLAALWTAGLTAVAMLGLWGYFFWLYLAPAYLAGNMQSLRKYVEHMGMMGSTSVTLTRSVVPRGPLGRLLSLSLLHEPYHGVHHTYARLPHDQLPRFVSLLERRADDQPPAYESYWQALAPMLRGLADPRIGAQWLRCAAPTAPARLPGWGVGTAVATRKVGLAASCAEEPSDEALYSIEPGGRSAGGVDGDGPAEGPPCHPTARGEQAREHRSAGQTGGRLLGPDREHQHRNEHPGAGRHAGDAAVGEGAAGR